MSDALITAGGTLLGGFLQRRSDKASTARQMRFQADMSNTAYQRQVEDMRKAGINPILAAKMGGASTPQGAAFKSPNILGDATKQYTSQAQQSAVQNNLEAQSRLTNAKALSVEEDNKLKGFKIRLEKEQALIDKARADTEVSYEQARVLDANVIKTMEQIKDLKQEIDQKKWRYYWEKEIYGAPLDTLKASYKNYLISMGIAGMTPKQNREFRKNFNKAMDFINNNFEKVIDNPELLIPVAGTWFGGWLAKIILDVVRSNRSRKLPRGIKPKGTRPQG